MSPKGRTLNSAKVLVGITGSVAAYKAVELIRRFRDEGASVSAVMTDASSRFITPLSVELATGQGGVFTGMFDEPLAHIELAAGADLMVVAPATANTIGRFSQGLADDLLSALFMAHRGPVVIAPAMNWRMYESPALRRNLALLKEHGVIEVEPVEGALACGEEGRGKMAPVERILEAARSSLCEKDLEGLKVVVTAGPTREHMDDVRFISNRSSGKMGYALARAALSRGAEVVLISGPVSLAPPYGARMINILSAEEMRGAVMGELDGAHALIMAAAVADFSPGEKVSGKPEKSELGPLELKATPDILTEAGRLDPGPVIVGFAAETGEDLTRAERKLKDKGADYIVFNNVSDPDAGFDVDTNKVTVLGGPEGPQSHPLMPKDEVAHIVLDLIGNK
jgi:phosphopantothenoylcysteine decarboxylase/phosphopantothenate--cysteine ligase